MRYWVLFVKRMYSSEPQYLQQRNNVPILTLRYEHMVTGAGLENAMAQVLTFLGTCIEALIGGTKWCSGALQA